MKSRHKLEEAQTLLAEWLTDNTVEAFEEDPEIDHARDLITEVLERTPS
jgi:hypothetical protein